MPFSVLTDGDKELAPEYNSMHCFLHLESLLMKKTSAGQNSMPSDMADDCLVQIPYVYRAMAAVYRLIGIALI